MVLLEGEGHTHQINDLIEVEEHPHVPLRTPYEPKSVPQRRHDPLLPGTPLLLLLHETVQEDTCGPPVPIPTVGGELEDHQISWEHGVVPNLVFVGIREGHYAVTGTGRARFANLSNTDSLPTKDTFLDPFPSRENNNLSTRDKF